MARVTTPPLTEKQKAHLRRVNGVKTRWAVDPVRTSKPREYDPQHVVDEFTPNRRAKHGAFSGSRLSPEIRREVERRKAARKEFLMGLSG